MTNGPQVPPIRDAVELRRRMAAGETLHHGVEPQGDAIKSKWWLRPSMTPVTAGAVRDLRNESSHG